MKVLGRQEASLEWSKGFHRSSKYLLQKSKPPNMQSLSFFFEGQQLHLQGALTSYHRSIEEQWWAAEAVACK